LSRRRRKRRRRRRRRRKQEESIKIIIKINKQGINLQQRLVLEDLGAEYSLRFLIYHLEQGVVLRGDEASKSTGERRDDSELKRKNGCSCKNHAIISCFPA